MRTRTFLLIVFVPLALLAFVRDILPWIRKEHERRSFERMTCTDWLRYEPAQRTSVVEVMIPDLQVVERDRLGFNAPVPEGTEAGFAATVAEACQAAGLADRPVLDVARKVWLVRSRPQDVAPAANPRGRR